MIDYKEINYVLRDISNNNTEGKLKQLIKRRCELDKQVYAWCVREVLQDIHYTAPSIETQLTALSGVKRREIMYFRERIRLFLLGKNVKIFRGTSEGEDPLRLSWTTSYEMAENCSKRHVNSIVMEATIKNKDIKAYFLNGEDEILAYVSKDCINHIHSVN